MKRTALAGTFALLAGLVSLILLASIVYSCRQGGHPHDMGTEPSGSSSHSASGLDASPTLVESGAHTSLTPNATIATRLQPGSA